jgi:hypothetical protein
MAHLEQQQFCEKVKELFPDHFKNVNVLDVGSLDINGNCRDLFTDSNYIGLDIAPGKNVDVVGYVHNFAPSIKFDTILSCEMLEHDMYATLSVLTMIHLLRPGGLLLITAATTGREPHGTTQHSPGDSPFTNGFYENVSVKKLVLCLDNFQDFVGFDVNINDHHDIQFWGVKK